MTVPAAQGCKVLQVVTNVGSYVPVSGPEHIRGEQWHADHSPAC